MVRDGDAWVGITAKPVAVAGAEELRPRALCRAVVPESAAAQRPAPTARTSRRPSTRRACDRVPPRTASSGTSTARSARSCAATTRPTRSPTRTGRTGAHARCTRSTGSATRRPAGILYDYINAIHPLTVAAHDGRPIYDGYIVAVAGGRFVGRRADQPVLAGAGGARPATAVQQRRRADHPHHVPVGLPAGHRRAAGPTATRPPTASATTRWPARRHATPDELYYAAAAGRTSIGPAAPSRRPRATRARAAASPAGSSSTRCCATSTAG